MAATPRFLCLSLGAALVLGGCVTPPEARLDDALPAAWTQGRDLAAPAPDLRGWWKAWGDARLDAVVEQALAANQDLAQVELRLKARQRLAGVADAAFKPVLSGNVRTLQDIAAIDSYFHASIDMAWDLGLFGASQSSLRARAAELLDAKARLQAARVALVADVVHHYLDLRLAQRQRALLAEQARLDQRGLALARVRQQQRLGTAEAVLLLQQQAAHTAAQQADMELAQARAAHALAALLGQARPEAGWLAADEKAGLPSTQALGLTALPADMLRTRPDIRIAQAAVERAAAEAGLAQAALYPRVVLAGSLLYSYNLTQNFRTTSDNIPTLGPQIDIPLFDWGQRRARADASELALQAAGQAYRQQVLDAVAEVETALAGLTAQGRRLIALQQVQDSLQQSNQRQQKRRQLGLDSEFGALAGQRAAIVARSDQATAQAAQALAYVALYKALGAAPLPEDGYEGGGPGA
ncbi:TolC family protein [Comamonas composti]|uniref:TolC family protein n=1 Tax=Comamonas composti TaxID=408558 RepID=UPI000423FCDB|nr:TolC family protein [Comamonas composti]